MSCSQLPKTCVPLPQQGAKSNVVSDRAANRTLLLYLPRCTRCSFSGDISHHRLVIIALHVSPENLWNEIRPLEATDVTWPVHTKSSLHHTHTNIYFPHYPDHLSQKQSADLSAVTLTDHTYHPRQAVSVQVGIQGGRSFLLSHRKNAIFLGFEGFYPKRELLFSLLFS